MAASLGYSSGRTRLDGHWCYRVSRSFDLSTMTCEDRSRRTRALPPRISRLGVATAGCLLLGLSLLGPSSASAASASGPGLVALGDSYSSGEGSPPFRSGTDKDGKGCHRSDKAWAHEIGEVVRQNVLLRACSGSTILNIYSYRGDGRQLDSVDSRSTRLVTMTLGGNDVRFADVLRMCVYGPRVDGLKDCRDKAQRELIDPRKSVLTEGQTNPEDAKLRLPPLSKVYTDIAERLAPGGKIIVAGYPRLFGDAFGSECRIGTALGGLRYHVASSDAAWINEKVLELNGIIESEVKKARSTTSTIRPDVSIDYVAVDEAFEGHRLCETASRLNGAQIEYDGLPGPKQTSFHPNVGGQHAYANSVKRGLLGWALHQPLQR